MTKIIAQNKGETIINDSFDEQIDDFWVHCDEVLTDWLWFGYAEQIEADAAYWAARE
jgi:3-phenylpropionate/cinnamic acid dioxygenase small subunit